MSFYSSRSIIVAILLEELLLLVLIRRVFPLSQPQSLRLLPIISLLIVALRSVWAGSTSLIRERSLHSLNWFLVFFKISLWFDSCVHVFLFGPCCVCHTTSISICSSMIQITNWSFISTSYWLFNSILTINNYSITYSIKITSYFLYLSILSLSFDHSHFSLQNSHFS